jgi:hypothetical protein
MNKALNSADAAADISTLASDLYTMEIVFVDPRGANWQAPLKGLGEDVQFLLIESSLDRMARGTTVLKGWSDLTGLYRVRPWRRPYFYTLWS